METLDNSLCIGKARIISAKKPNYSLLCSENIDTIPLGEQLRVMRLRTGYTIEQAAQAIGVERRMVMNYELDKVKRMKTEVVSRLLKLYKGYCNVVLALNRQSAKLICGSIKPNISCACVAKKSRYSCIRYAAEIPARYTLYRQQQYRKAQDVELSRTTLANWIIRGSRLL